MLERDAGRHLKGLVQLDDACWAASAACRASASAFARSCFF